MRLVLDVETTIKNKGNPFTAENKLVVVGVLDIDTGETFYYWENFHELQEKIDNCRLLIGFNLKFDLHWIRRAGVNFGLDLRIWDAQLAEFLLENQSNPYPSLQKACEKYELPGKLDIVKTEYWDKGIDTTEIPQKILTEYLCGDLEATKTVFDKQAQLLMGNQLKLFSLQCQDLLVLQEMDYNGIRINTDESLRLAAVDDAKDNRGCR